MDTQDIRTLKILQEYDAGDSPSQRYLSRKLDISLGLVNSFLKRLAKKGYFKITTIPLGNTVRSGGKVESLRACPVARGVRYTARNNSPIRTILVLGALFLYRQWSAMIIFISKDYLLSLIYMVLFIRR